MKHKCQCFTYLMKFPGGNTDLLTHRPVLNSSIPKAVLLQCFATPLSILFQRAKLYYDPDLGSYYKYDDQLKTYTLHSRVDLPECQMRKRKPEREVEIILIDEDELSGQSIMKS